jgi:hypothetical protein
MKLLPGGAYQRHLGSGKILFAAQVCYVLGDLSP